MLYAIKIGFEEFDLINQGEVQRMFSYCEKQFGFEGEEWEEVKSEFDYEKMSELLESIDVEYTEFIE